MTAAQQSRHLLLLAGMALSVTSFAQAPAAPAAAALAPAAPLMIDVRNYGAFCDSGRHDDTEGFRAAIAAADNVPFAKITYPPGCFISDTLTFGGRTNKYATISMSGPSEYRPITY